MILALAEVALEEQRGRSRGRKNNDFWNPQYAPIEKLDSAINSILKYELTHSIAVSDLICKGEYGSNFAFNHSFQCSLPMVGHIPLFYEQAF